MPRVEAGGLRETVSMPVDVLVQILHLCSPWTKFCLAATCHAMRAYANEQRLSTRLTKESEPVLIRDVSVYSITDSTFCFTCNSPFGADEAAEGQLLLMNDYWLCRRQACTTSSTRVTQVRPVFTGTLLPGRLPGPAPFQEPQSTFTKLVNSMSQGCYRPMPYQTDTGATSHLQENWFYKDVVVYVTCKATAVQIELGDLKPICEIAKDWSQQLTQDQRRRIMHSYVRIPLENSYRRFVAYTYLQACIGVDRAVTYGYAFALPCLPDGETTCWKPLQL